jgi:C1A family cysteine protease
VKRHFGTGRDSVSSLDWNYRPRSSIVRRLSAVADLRRHCPPVYDQLHLNSCSANAIAAALRYNELKEGRSHVASPSRLFIYYNERVLAGVVGTNCAVPLRDGFRTMSRIGACSELRGGHAVLAVGYDHARRLITFRNSWGAAWGDGGYGYLPYAFFTSPSLTWDFWTMRRVS